MEYSNESPVDVLDLGEITENTRGPWGHYADDVLMQDMAGLSND